MNPLPFLHLHVKTEYFDQIKALEVEKARVERWNGAYPGFLLSGGAQAPGLLLNVQAK